MGVATGLLPTKGTTLPLVSFGGSSLVASLASIGLILAVARPRKAQGGPDGARHRAGRRGAPGDTIFPALALAKTIREHAPGARVSFIGSDRGLEGRYVPAAGFELDRVASAQVSGKELAGGGLGRGGGGARGTLQARRLLRARGADLVIGVGGYASVPAVAAALSMRLPTALVEPNARAGARQSPARPLRARAVFVQFEGARSAFPRERVHLTGYPVRAFPETRTRPADGRVRLLVSGGEPGSPGDQSSGCARCCRNWPAGTSRSPTNPARRTSSGCSAPIRRPGVSAHVAPFFDDLPARLAASDVLVARAGAADRRRALPGRGGRHPGSLPTRRRRSSNAQRPASWSATGRAN